MKYLAPIRKTLGFPTIFNYLGPLTNPAGALNQIIGVSIPEMTSKIANVLKYLGSDHVIVVHGKDGMCELTVNAPNNVVELKNGKINEYIISAEDVGLKHGNLKDIIVDSPEESASLIKKILTGDKKGTAKDIAVFNAAGALVVANIAKDLKEGVLIAKETINSGKAFEKLENLRSVSNQQY